MQNEHQQNDEALILDVNLEDSDLLHLVREPITKSQTYWDSSFSGTGLKKIREDNMNLWLPNHWKGQDVYDYQEMSTYQDNRIFASTETINSTVNARIPQVQVMPGSDSVISLQLAKDAQRAGEAYVEKYDVLDLFRLSGRNLQIKRGAFIKLRWDPSIGEDGEIVSEFVPPEDIIVDKDAKMGAVPRFIVHIIRGKTAEDLLAEFPDGQQEIYAAIGVKRKDGKGKLVAQKTMLSKKLDVYEVWFQYRDGGELKSGVAWMDSDMRHVFDKTANPNWNYEETDGRASNLLDNPEPPFIPINYLNDGSSYFDQTTLIEQAASLQRILDKRGFQIMENADQAGSGLVFNTQMISKTDIAKLTGSPDERIGVKGDVNRAVARVSPPPLPAYVIQDKQDARNEIDNIFATHAPLRGETSGNATLGQDVMQQRGDLTRMDDVARAIERQAKHYFRYLYQMMKVYYTEDHWFCINGSEAGQFDFVLMRGDFVEDGMDIRVGEGSMKPQDKVTQQKWVSDLVTVGMIDPLTVYEVANGGNLPTPQKMLERYMMFKTDPMGYLGKTKDDDFSREALMDIQTMNAGEMPEVRDEYQPVYLKFMNSYMLGGEFQKQADTVKAIYGQYLRMVQAVMSQQLALMMTQMPDQGQMDQAAQRDAMQADLQNRLMPQGQGGQPGQPGATGRVVGPKPQAPTNNANPQQSLAQSIVPTRMSQVA